MSVYMNSITEGMQMKSARRKYENEKMMVLNDFLIDVLREKNYFIMTTKTLNAFCRNKVDFVDSIYYDHKLLFSMESIIEKGKKLNEYLLSLTDNDEKICQIEKNDKNLLKLLN